MKSADRIRDTLDSQGRFERLPYLASVMDRYCGGAYRVHKRIDRFFDERNWRMVALRNVVILDGVFCEPAATASVDWAGCDRSCFLFWKEAWLERSTRQ